MATGKATGIDPATGAGIAVSFLDGVVTAVEPDDTNDRVYLSAGLVDLQVNGFGGLDFNGPDVTPDIVLRLCQLQAAQGVARFLPTLITASTRSLVNGLKVIAEARNAYVLARQMMPGVHIEGPYISPHDGPRGAHALEHIRAPSLDEFAEWDAAAPGLIRLVTAAPEQPGSIDYIKALTARGVHVALGHTAATPEEIHAAAEAGACLSTHLGNGAAANLPRHPNFIWAQLADDRLTATFIADGHHLPADTLKAMMRAKSLERSILVSDSVRAAGLAPGIYDEAIGARVEVFSNGRIGVAGTPYLAGAGLSLSANVAIATGMAGLSLAQSLELATINPGRFVGGGRLAVGEPANLIRFNWRPGDAGLEICDTFVHGVRINA